MSMRLARLERTVAAPTRTAVRPPGAIDGLLLDACNILYDDTSWRRWLLRLLAHVGAGVRDASLFRVRGRDCMAEVHRGRRCFCDALGEYLASLGLSAGQIEELQAAAQAQRRCLQGVVRPLTGVRSTLRELHQSGVALAVLCNSEQSGDAMRQWLERFGMGQIFRAVISSIDLGQAMPDPASYGAALRAMQLPARRVAFVGHRAVELAGAAALGMTTIAFNRDADARADLVLDRFEDLLQVAAATVVCAAAA
jgi:FMN phosphatase YigB (HAD superfamily)